ncbi:MAG: hypothetical protein AAF984_06475 [Verrucomicrobiota bacterium]
MLKTKKIHQLIPIDSPAGLVLFIVVFLALGNMENVRAQSQKDAEAVVADPITSPPFSSKWSVAIQYSPQNKTKTKGKKQEAPITSVHFAEGVMGKKYGKVTFKRNNNITQTFYTINGQLLRKYGNSKDYTYTKAKDGYTDYQKYYANRYFLVTGFPGITTLTKDDFVGIREHQELGTVAYYRVEKVPLKPDPDYPPEEQIYLPADGPQVSVEAFFDVNSGLPIQARVEKSLYIYNVKLGTYEDPPLPQEAQKMINEVEQSVLLRKMLMQYGGHKKS